MHSTFMISYYLRYYKIVTLYKKKNKKKLLLMTIAKERERGVKNMMQTK